MTDWCSWITNLSHQIRPRTASRQPPKRWGVRNGFWYFIIYALLGKWLWLQLPARDDSRWADLVIKPKRAITSSSLFIMPPQGIRSSIGSSGWAGQLGLSLTICKTPILYVAGNPFHFWNIHICFCFFLAGHVVATLLERFWALIKRIAFKKSLSPAISSWSWLTPPYSEDFTVELPKVLPYASQKP